jgi:hypothetical protein
MLIDTGNSIRDEVPFDEKMLYNVVRDAPRDVPETDILAEPLFCLAFNEDWRPHITGAIETLSKWTAWNDAEDETSTGTIQIWKLLGQDYECPDGDCPEELTIPDIIADDTYFETEYVPVTFGEYYSETVANEATQAAAYDTTPQSIAPDAPTGTPNAIEKNALCAAVHRFVSLYASTKLCLIQSKNFIEILWTKLAGAVNDMYDAVVTVMSPIYSPNIYSCFVSDAVAITALQDESAIEELACFIYDELKTVTMSESNFNTAVGDAATTLTGDAQKIACIMNNDNSLSLYINMLEAYNVALGQDDAECPCEAPTTYWMLYMDFRTGNRYGTTSVVWNGGVNDGYWNGSAYVVNKTPVVSTLNVAFGLANLGSDYVIRAAATRSKRRGSDGHANDSSGLYGFTLEGQGGTNSLVLNSNGNVANTDDVEIGLINAGSVAVVRSFAIRSRVNQATNVTPCELEAHQLVIWGLPDGSGNKPSGAVWAGASLPGTIAGLFP